MALAIPPPPDEERKRSQVPLEQVDSPSLQSDFPSGFNAHKIGTFKLAGPGDINPSVKQEAGLAPTDQEKEILSGNNRWDKIQSAEIRNKYNEMDPAERKAREDAALMKASQSFMTIYHDGLPMRKSSLEELLATTMKRQADPMTGPIARPPLTYS